MCAVMHRVLSSRTEPEVSDEEVRARLATRWGRFKAHADFLFNDHQVLRLMFSNAHEVGDGLWRSNQPGPGRLKRWAEQGIKTVINLRGVSPASYHVIERDACARLGLDLISLRLYSRDAPHPGAPRIIKTMFDEIAYPALIHCKSGSDRAGLMGVLFRHFRLGEPFSVAREQLGWKYLHMKIGKTGILDAYIDKYIAEGEAKGIDYITWAETKFDRAAFKDAYRSTALGDFIVDKLLQRE
jgi:protein tyrosine/serine phosphatase